MHLMSIVCDLYLLLVSDYLTITSCGNYNCIATCVHGILDNKYFAVNLISGSACLCWPTAHFDHNYPNMMMTSRPDPVDAELSVARSFIGCKYLALVGLCKSLLIQMRLSCTE